MSRMKRRGTIGGRAGMAAYNHAVASLGATVLSLSSLILFRLKACCRQSSRLLHAWCSGSRCCKTSQTSDNYKSVGQRNKLDTHSPTKIRTTMGTVTNDAQRSLVTLLLAVELATFLCWHVEWIKVYGLWKGLY
jgi:hypothetical protein